MTFKAGKLATLLVASAMLAGCGYYACEDDIKLLYIPRGVWHNDPDHVWLDAQRLEIEFEGRLRSPTEVDPRRFALLRYNVDIDGHDHDSCTFEICYADLGVQAFPDALEWNPDKPWNLVLHFAEPIPASSCDPWPNDRVEYQALELIYLGYDDNADSDPIAAPDELAFWDDHPISAFGPPELKDWLQGCRESGSCELEADLCTPRGGWGDVDGSSGLWFRQRRVRCPE